MHLVTSWRGRKKGSLQTSRKGRKMCLSADGWKRLIATVTRDRSLLGLLRH